MSQRFEGMICLRPDTYYKIEAYLINECRKYLAGHPHGIEVILLDAYSYWKLFVQDTEFKATYVMGDINPVIRRFFQRHNLPEPRWGVIPVETTQLFVLIQRNHPLDVIQDADYHSQKMLKDQLRYEPRLSYEDFVDIAKEGEES